MTRQGFKKPLVVASVLLAQGALIAAASWQPLLARTTGQEVRVRVGAFDPIDPFRGAYVALQYPDLAGPWAPNESYPSGAVYLTLADQGDYSTVSARTDSRPSSGTYQACEKSWRGAECGVESYFLPQGKAADVGSALSGGGAIAVLKVDRWGHAALVRLEMPPTGMPTVPPVEASMMPTGEPTEPPTSESPR